jgi:hypothetical protein
VAQADAVARVADVVVELDHQLNNSPHRSHPAATIRDHAFRYGPFLCAPVGYAIDQRSIYH